MILVCILLPFIAGALIPVIKWKKRSLMELYIEAMVILN